LKWILIIVCFLASAAEPARSEPPERGEPSVRSAGSALDSIVLDEGIIRARRIELKNDLEMLSREEVPGLRKWQRKKSARVAMYSSMLLPGLWQVYNGRRIKTIIMVGLSTIYMSKIWLEHKNAQKRRIIRDTFPVDSNSWRNENAWVDFHKAHSLDYAWWSGAIWLIGALDAYIDAHLYDIRVYKPTMTGGAGRSSYLTVGVSF